MASQESAWARLRDAAVGGPKVLLATGTGGHRAALHLENLLAAALTARGAEVHVLLCDSVLPACLQATSDEFWSTTTFARHGPSTLCWECAEPGRKGYHRLGLRIHRYSDWIRPEEHAEAKAISETTAPGAIPSYSRNGLKIGEHAFAGALRFFARGDLANEPQGDRILRRYLHASLLTAFAMGRLTEKHGFDVACFHHGIYVPQGIVGEVARLKGVRIVNWNPAYRKRCFIFSHGDTYHHTLLSEPTSEWEELEWTQEREQRVMEYLKSRWQGTQDWIWFHEKPQEDLATIARSLGFDPSRPAVGMLTNVVWDAQLHYPANAFSDMVDWAVRTVEYFIKRPEIQLVVRIHPAEIRGTLRSRQPMVEEIRRRFPTLPSNIVIIPPDSNASTYVVMQVCDSVLIYGTKTGVELTSMGIPVIVAGEAWIRGKGVTMDAETQEEYWRLLDRLPIGRKLDQETTRRARKYAYHFFFRRMIPVKAMRPRKGWPPYLLDVGGLDELLPGYDRGLDVVCDGILKGDHFVYDGA